jgi:uncharacterized damage-inducible protein DinB
MKTDDLYLLYEYNYWANRRILTACSKVSAEQYSAPAALGTGHGGLRATLVHTLDAEESWRTAFQKHFVAYDSMKGSLP